MFGRTDWTGLDSSKGKKIKTLYIALFNCSVRSYAVLYARHILLVKQTDILVVLPDLVHLISRGTHPDPVRRAAFFQLENLNMQQLVL